MRHAHAERYQHVQTRQCRCARTGCDQLDLADIFTNNFQSIDDSGTNDDRSAVLVVVKDRNLHPFAQLLFNVETFRCLDILKIDAAECGLQCGDDIDQLVRIALVHFDIENVDTGEFLEQYRFAFHDRLRCQRADGAETKHGRAIGNDTDQIAACSQIARLGRVFDDGFAHHRDTGCVR